MCTPNACGRQVLGPHLSPKPMKFKKYFWVGTSLAVQWLRLCLPVQRAGGLILGWGAKISHAQNQNIKKKQYCNTFNKDFKK